MQFFSFTDSYLPKNDKRVLQVGYVYKDLNQDLKNLQELINQNKDIKDSNAYLIFNDGSQSLKETRTKESLQNLKDRGMICQP